LGNDGHSGPTIVKGHSEVNQWHYCQKYLLGAQKTALCRYDYDTGILDPYGAPIFMCQIWQFIYSTLDSDKQKIIKEKNLFN